ncbi:MAG: PD-(D/E)XK nuclease family protein [Tannerellaceae bacterium]|jgi:CRISPR/Cas system-associated exonuclease Cas4 (RecB family)|nr:PD-(D/E)XK nuclease family protein [Tannerellaceae bacterium]
MMPEGTEKDAKYEPHTLASFVITMKPFLYQIASLFYLKYGTGVTRFTFVFPNRRAGLFFRNYLAEVCGKPIFSPTILTISDLFLNLSGMKTADRIFMLFSLYRIYLRESASEESFDEFFHWGEMLLNDFDDVDKYMVNPEMLFSNVTDLRTIEYDFSFLNEKQIEAIRSFWSSFSPERKGTNRQNFLAVWQILYKLYSGLKEELAAQGKGYEGMIARDAVERLENGQVSDLPYRKVIFVGLNALSPVEERLLLLLKKRGIADFYWDYASDMVTDKENRASFFVERNLKLFPSQFTLPQEDSHSKPFIEVVAIPSAVGQAKHVHNLLEAMAGSADGLTEENSLRTAVVLPDERLLIPVLNSIPESIRRINVTMGYPLAGSPIATLVDCILAMHRHVRYIDREPSFYFRDVLPVLNHRYIAAAAQERAQEIAGSIAQNNQAYIPASSLGVTPFLQALFTPIEQTADASAYLISILAELNKTIESSQQSSGMEQEFIFHFFTTVNRLKEVMDDKAVDMNLDTYFRLLRQLAGTITIPFRGEPLSGLQIMGVLETRALDFDRLIILSVNEGIFPQKKTSSSFIPYNLRRGFDLPTYEHQDSVWAYHFYRLIHRAGHVSLLYDSRNNAMQTGEMSRFIHQLHYHYEMPLHKKIIIYNVSSSGKTPIIIDKTQPVRERLNAYRKGGTKALSASAVNIWLDCPLKFYFTFIEGVREEEEVSETVESNIFGSILHKVMEDVYKPFAGKMITADILRAVIKDRKTLSYTIAAAFADIFFKTRNVRPLAGQNFLTGEMIRKYVEKILDHDAKTLTPFRYIASEKKMNSLINLSNGDEIQLKGFIDRIDEPEGNTRIVDYKSGAGLSSFRSIESLFDANEKYRAKAVMQVFMYAWMYERLPEYGGQTLSPAIYYMRSLFTGNFDASVYLHAERSNYQAIEHFGLYSAPFEAALRDCLDRIFSPTTPFTQSPTGKACSYCPFSNICG